MSKRPFDTLQPKITRNDRFAQMSHQEKIIEQKKREIQAKLEAKQKSTGSETKEKPSNTTPKQPNKSLPQKSPETKKTGGFNTFSNDGSFLDQFKQIKDRKFDSKLKSFNRSKERDNPQEKNSSEKNRWTPRWRSPSPKDRQSKKPSRFDKTHNFEPKITINTSFSSQNYETSQNFSHQSILKNSHPVSDVPYATVTQPCESIIAAPPVLLNVPPPQMVHGPISNIVLAPQTQNVILTPSTCSVLTPTNVLTTVNIIPPSLMTHQNAMPVPPPVLPSVELSAIPPPNPIQVQNIPQPDPINTMNIPPPAPLQVHNIPTPTSLQLNEIPNPKPLDLLTIPAPSEEKNISDPDFIKNVPPPNKCVPPPSITEVPPPSTIVQAPFMPPLLQSTINNLQNVSATPNNFSLSLVQGAAQTTTAQIPSLMAQPILPPPGMAVNVNCPPPILPIHTAGGGMMQTPPPSFVSQPPLPPPSPVTTQMPPMNVPPPTAVPPLVAGLGAPFKDMNAGTADFEAMSSLARMVAECGPGIEDAVKQKKTQDASLWFLFHKESAAYRHYLALVDQYKKEKQLEEERRSDVNPEDMYEPEMALEDNDVIKTDANDDPQESTNCDNSKRGKKRRSRWGDKEANVTSPIVLQSTIVPNTSGPPMLSKITRTDPGLIHYAINTYGSSNLSEEDWKKAEDNYKIHLLYQDMVKKREELKRLQLQGKNKYDYDSDEDTDGGTWEHKLREKEMTATELWAEELTRQAEGKHHIGDFLPPEELKRFMENSNAAKEGRQPNFSDYKEFKIKEDNIGFKMLQKLGWTEGQGLGTSGSGIVEPVNKGAPREHTQGLGLNLNDATEGEDEYESYRKRMMLAYRFRPNPLNNPRRPYY